jgi:hypothetical protein
LAGELERPSSSATARRPALRSIRDMIPPPVWLATYEIALVQLKRAAIGDALDNFDKVSKLVLLPPLFRTLTLFCVDLAKGL